MKKIKLLSFGLLSMLVMLLTLTTNVYADIESDTTNISNYEILKLYAYKNNSLVETFDLEADMLSLQIYHWERHNVYQGNDEYQYDTPHYKVFQNRNMLNDEIFYDEIDISFFEFKIQNEMTVSFDTDWSQDNDVNKPFTLNPGTYRYGVKRYAEADEGALFHPNTYLESGWLDLEMFLYKLNPNGSIKEVKYEFLKENHYKGITSTINFNFRTEISQPAISGEHTVIANVDSPYTVDRIKQIAELTATDGYYGDLTDQIEVVSDNYTGNSTKVGNYEIEFKVTNGSNLSATFKLIVAVKDLVAPVINGPATSEISYTEKLNLEAFLTDFTVTDNHDETVLLNVDSNTYVDNEEKVGTYQIKLSATDKSNNKTTFTHTIKVIDDVKPNFVDEHSGKITVNWRDRIDDNFLLLDLTANDKVDGDLTNEIKIVDDGKIKNILGTYNVKYEVTDSAGNKSTYTRKYEIITTDAPVFWISKNLLLISDVNQLSNNQLANELASYENIKMASFTMVKDEYTGKEDIPGEYEVIVAIADTDGTEHQVSRTIRVFAEEDMPEPEPSFIDKVINFFVSAWNLIVKIATWIWNAIKWLWNLVFGWIGK